MADIRINCGGPAVNAGGYAWEADRGYNGGFEFPTTHGIENHGGFEVIYQTSRWNFNLLEYAFDVPNGTYDVVFRWAELFNQMGRDTRWFNVDINGSRVVVDGVPLTNFSIYDLAGSRLFGAVNRRTRVIITGGRIVISLRAVRENPTLNAIEILQVGGAGGGGEPTPVYECAVNINSGGAAFTDSRGFLWAADTGYSGDGTGSYNVYQAQGRWAEIANTNEQGLYNVQRYGQTWLQYQFSVANGWYAVTLKYAELDQIAAGVRRFNVLINGEQKETNFDVVALAGGTLRALDRQYVIQVTTGSVIIRFNSVSHPPNVNAIAICQTQEPQPGPPPVTGLPAHLESVSLAIDGQDVTEIALVAETRINYASNNRVSTANVVLLGPAPGNVPRWDYAKWDQAVYGFNLRTMSLIQIYSGKPLELRIWRADYGYSATGYTEPFFVPVNAAIGNTVNPALYQGSRWVRGTGTRLIYQFSVPNATYSVTLKWAEIAIGSIWADTTARVFDVYLQGTRVDQNVNVEQRAGGIRIAYDRTYTANVTNGQLTIWIQSIQGNPMVNAIEITGAADFEPIRISCGSNAYWEWITDPDSTMLFNGVVMQVTMKDTDAKWVTTRYELACNDWAVELDRTIVVSSVEGHLLPNEIFPKDDADFIVRMLQTRTSRVNPRLIIGGHVIQALDYIGKSIRQILDDLCVLTNSVWYLDQIGLLHYFPASLAPGAPFAVSTEYDNERTFPFRMDNFNIDFSNPANSAWIFGHETWFWGQPMPESVVYLPDDASIAAYGEWNYAILDGSINTREEALTRARALLAASAYPIERGQFTVWRHGLYPGQLMHITDSFMNVDGSWLISSVSLVWRAKDIIEYTVNFGPPAPSLDSILRALDVRTRVVSPVSTITPGTAGFTGVFETNDGRRVRCRRGMIIAIEEATNGQRNE
jgi:hypothetical protein